MFATLAHWFALARTAHDRRLAVEALSRLSDAQLLDLGLERGTIEDHVRKGMPFLAFERSRAVPLHVSVQGCG